MDNWKIMQSFGEYLIRSGLNEAPKQTDYRGLPDERKDWSRSRRLAYIHIVTGLEIVLKSWLVHKDYNIYKVKTKPQIFLNSEKSCELDTDRTVDLVVVLSFFRELTGLPLVKIDEVRKCANYFKHESASNKNYPCNQDYLIINFCEELSLLYHALELWPQEKELNDGITKWCPKCTLPVAKKGRPKVQ